MVVQLAMEKTELESQLRLEKFEAENRQQIEIEQLMIRILKQEEEK